MMNLFSIPAVGTWYGLGPKLTSLRYNGNSAAPDPRKKSMFCNGKGSRHRRLVPMSPL